MDEVAVPATRHPTRPGQRRSVQAGHDPFDRAAHIMAFASKRRPGNARSGAFAHCHLSVMQTRQIGRKRGVATHSVPAQPDGTDTGQGPVRPNIENHRSSV